MINCKEINKNKDARIISDLFEYREKFAFTPTPIHELKNLYKRIPKINGQKIYIKRDDLTGLAFGGNKTRKLEFFLKELIDMRFDSVITVGCPQSNHCRQTAASCVLYSIPCYLILVGSKEEYIKEGNILLNIKLGAEMILVENEAEAKLKIEKLTEKLKSEGRNPFFIPPGGSNPTGCLGYALAFKEILEDEIKLNLKFEYIFFASSSLGTQSGLILGREIFDKTEFKRKIYGISICKSFLDTDSNLTPEKKIVNMIMDFNSKYKTDVEVFENDVIYDQRFNESGYAVISKDDKMAMEIFAKTEAIFLDPVYSARAAAGMIKMIENEEIEKDANILFIHTGGGPSLFVKHFNELN